MLRLYRSRSVFTYAQPALAGIRVMLRQLFIYCYYQLRSLKVAKPVLNEH